MKKQDINACLDDVEGLGAFLELEIIADDYQKDEALGRINTLLKLLGYQTTDTMTQSYLSMLQRIEKRNRTLQMHKAGFSLQPENLTVI